MPNQIGMTYEHVLNLQTGAEGRIEFQFPMDERKTFRVSLAAIDPIAGSADLEIENLWGAYEMREYVPAAGRWKAISPDRNGELHAIVSFGGGKHLSVTSEFATIHSLDLVNVTWENPVVRLTFREMGRVQGS